MRDSAKSALTLAVLCGLLVVAGVWGLAALTAPLPDRDPPPLCTDQTIPAGRQLFRDQVVVSVFNASGRSGLASATQELLVERGFVAADTGNAPSMAAGVQIWADDPANPAVQLVRKQFRGAKVVPGDTLGRGVVVVLGQRFGGLRDKDVESVTGKVDAKVCVPAPGVAESS